MNPLTKAPLDREAGYRLLGELQDEFHLISGPLGTMVGLYETAVDDLCSWQIGKTKVRPKVVASTATVRRAADQVRNVFMRRLAIFPPKALDVEDDTRNEQNRCLCKFKPGVAGPAADLKVVVPPANEMGFVQCR